MLNIAVPKGRLFDAVISYLRLSGLTLDFKNDRDYSPVSDDPDVRVKIFKPRVVPQLLALGQYDIGFCGLDLVREAGYDEVIPLQNLGWNPVKLVVATSEHTPRIHIDPPKRPLVIASEYVNLATHWALEHNLAHILIQTWGSTEAFVPDEADLIFDCVETGKTMRTNGLVIIDEIMKSATHLVASAQAFRDPVKRKKIHALFEKDTAVLAEGEDIYG